LWGGVWGGGGGGVGRGRWSKEKCNFWSFKLIFQKSFQKIPPVFCHFLIFRCKLARCFQKHLHFGPFVSLQRKSSRKLTPFSGNFIKWIKLCRSIPRWRCVSKLHCLKSLKRGPQGKNVKGLDLLDLSMATIWYHSIVSTGHIAILQTNYVVQFFQLTIAPSRLWRSVWSVNHTLLSNG